MTAHYTIGRHLLDRLRELGIDTVFGVPGDYILDLIEMIIDDPALNWVGNCNELNAAYAADGYARVNGAAALVVTGGVGDLGAAGGIGGSFAENVPVVVISGLPGPGAGPGGRAPAVHHSLGDGSFAPYRRMMAEITCAQAELNADNAVDEVDRACTAAWRRKQPVFITLPADVATKPCQPPKTGLALDETSSDPDELDDFLSKVAEKAAIANSPVLLADVGVRQARAVTDLSRLIDTTGIPWASTWAASWDLDTTGSSYLGAYVGKGPAVAQVDGASMLIRVGARLDEFGRGKADPAYSGPELIDIAHVGASIGDQHFPSLHLPEVLTRLSAALPKAAAPPAPARSPRAPFVASADTVLRQNRLWECLSGYIRPGDHLVVDIGTASIGLRSITLPAEVSVMAQNIWGAIGWSLPALLGASLADPGRRPILLVGDGAFALTAQEISTLLRQRVAALLVVLNNGGYLIEDIVGGRRIACNDLWNWKYAALPDVFDGDDAYGALGLRVSTEEELVQALDEAQSAQAEGRLVLLEIALDRSDIPQLRPAAS